ncbi:MAG TPA: PSD1 and planctomycete cytochrome C domain-containing protein, partial [Verrucomicrobiae bacterium]|nr:PSD1 and planctomycete cytochrome C domain-containing protein [Verrucomicrobiae bacterium]
SCYGCHGPKKEEAGLRWDVKEVALKGGESGPAIVPGKSAESRMIHLVAGLQDDLVMPAKGERLSAEQIGLLRAWIDQGAGWPDSASVKITSNRDHWAFKAPLRSALPEVKNRKWIRNPIDHFILARIEKEGLKPSPEADRVTLIRRLSLDLLGLPPTIREVDVFLADRNPNAYDALVERLLSSPHCGERWGRHWLDAARYADSNGFEKDAKRSIWPYRDWVIGAFNRDLSFDRFTIEQLAGDLLPRDPGSGDQDPIIATGFLRNSMLNQEGGIEPEQFRTEAMIDRMDAVGRTWLGLTIACAQCHNHKYDPISQKEYYQLFAFLNNDDEPFIEIPTPEEQKRRGEILAKVRELEDKAMRDTANLTERMAEWEKNTADAEGDWTVLDAKEWINFATKFEKQSDLSLLGGGDVKPGGTMKVWVDTSLTSITGFRLEILTHPNLPYGGPGQVAKGNFLLKEFAVEAYPLTGPAETNKIQFGRALADAEAPGFSITNAIDGNTEKGGWSGDFGPVLRNHERRAVFECAEPIPGFPGGTRLLITLHETHSNGDGHSGAPDKESKLDCHMIGRFRLAVTTRPAPLAVDPLTPLQRKLLAIPGAQRSPEWQRDLFNVFRLNDASFAEVNKQVHDVLTNWPYAATTLVLQQRAEPRVTRLFKRGDWQKPGDAVEPDVPAVLHPFPKTAPRNRLGFAQWLVDRRSPTVARVIVNRIWQAYFGQGLVTTPEDFGTRVETPSHPELLDWLAVEFMDPSVPVEPFNRSTLRPWSIKHLHRLIVNSATYRQSSKVAPELYSKDQYNRLLARGPRFRVEGETVQDIALFAGGLLNPKIGGPSVYPPIPTNVADQVYGQFSWPETRGEDRYRRGMYTFWKRAMPFPSLLAFDAPPAEASCTRRVRSNTPLQALTTLNERTYVEAAQAMGLRVLKEGGGNERSRAIYAFRLCTGRTPTASELKALLKFWEEQYDYFESRTADAVNVAVADLKQMPPDVNLHKVAAWTMVSRAILNLDETITRE